MSDSSYTRIIALDYGRRRIGVAVSDPLRITAQGIKPLIVKDIDDALAKLKCVLDQYDEPTIVLGLPLDMRGEIGEMAKEVQEFGEKIIDKLKVPVEYYDERFTSSQAERALHEMGVKTGHNKSKVDTLSAVFLLQSYLDKISR